jgi:general secretion pathway protein I
VSPNPESGFTLFETLIAMIVLSIGLVSLFEAHSGALRTIGTAADYAKARIIAQGLMAEAVSGWPKKLVSKKGVADGFRWSVQFATETAPWARVQARDGWKLRQIRVIVAWPGGRQLELNSLKLERANG